MPAIVVCVSTSFTIPPMGSKETVPMRRAVSADVRRVAFGLGLGQSLTRQGRQVQTMDRILACDTNIAYSHDRSSVHAFTRTPPNPGGMGNPQRRSGRPCSGAG